MAVILVIDDDKTMRDMAKHLLTRNLYQVLTASDGEKGMKLIQENSIDLVITDMIMPNQEGIETITKVKEEYPKLKIIAISGGIYGNSEDYLYIAKALGADLVFPKPVKTEMLLNGINLLLSN